MATKPKKTLYHSELVNLGPVEVEIKSDILQSQFRGHNDYVIMNLDGHDRNYECENDQCVKALDRLKGQTVIIEAIGSRDDAEIIVSEATNGGRGGRGDDRERGGDRRDERRESRRDDRTDGRRDRERDNDRGNDRRESRREEAPPRDERRTDTTQRQTSQKPAQDPAKAEAWAIHHAKEECGRMINAALMCLKSADIVEEARKEQGKPLPAEQKQALVASFWIRMKDIGKINALPSRLLHKQPEPPKSEPQQQRQPAAESRTDEQRQRSAEAPQPDAPPATDERPPDDDVPF